MLSISKFHICHSRWHVLSSSTVTAVKNASSTTMLLKRLTGNEKAKKPHHPSYTKIRWTNLKLLFITQCLLRVSCGSECKCWRIIRNPFSTLTADMFYSFSSHSSIIFISYWFWLTVSDLWDMDIFYRNISDLWTSAVWSSESHQDGGEWKSWGKTESSGNYDNRVEDPSHS